MKKTAPTQFNIHTNARERWSPRAFSPKPVETEKLQSLFEAARWAASAFNEQPWRFIIGIKKYSKLWGIGISDGQARHRF